MHIITSKCQGICHTTRSDKSHSYKTGWFLLFRTPHPGLLKMAVFCPAFQSSFSTSALSLFLFVPIYLCSHYLFLLSFPNVTVHFYSLMLVAQCQSWTTVILFPPPVGGVWLGPYIISVICTCHPPRQHNLTYPEDACTPDSDCLQSYKGCVFCSLSVGAIEGQQCVPGFSK